MSTVRSPHSRKTTGRPTKGPDKSFLAVAEKLFTTLETFTSVRAGDLSLDEITKKTGLPKSTTFRLLNSLEKCGYLRKNEDSGRFSLGERFFDLAGSTLPYERLISIARPYLQSLMLTAGESVNLGVFDEGLVAHIFSIDSPKPYRVAATVGNRAYLHCTGMGKALAAHLPEKMLASWLKKHGLPRRTRKTLTTMSQLRRELVKIRHAGFSHDNQEDVEGVECVAAPIYGSDGKVLAAVSLSGPAVRMAPQAASMRKAIQETARRISFAFGWTPETLQNEL